MRDRNPSRSFFTTHSRHRRRRFVPMPIATREPVPTRRWQTSDAAFRTQPVATRSWTLASTPSAFTSSVSHFVSWNAGEGLAECVASIADAVVGDVELGRVIVVDNASSDGSLEGAVQAARERGVRLTVVRNAANRGFGSACNQGAALGTAPHVLFLNPDTRLFADSLSRPLRELARSPELAVASVALVGDDGHVARSCARFPTPWTYLWIGLGLDRLFAERSF